MTESATITFSQAGVHAPVYVVTSLSDPPWETLEMEVHKAQTASTNPIFTRHFENVAEGDYQYKIRIGDGHWVVDDSRDVATDEHGNRNNVLHVEAATRPEILSSVNNAVLHQEKSRVSRESRSDSIVDTNEDISRSEKLPITSEDNTEPSSDDDQAAPLFRHESFQSSEAPSSAALETIDELSTRHTSSEEITHTSSDQDSQDGELDHAPLMSHETGFEDEDFDELNNGPLLSHETVMNGGIHSSDEYVDELDAAPLLSHETGFSEYKGSEIATKSDFSEDDISEPRHYMYDEDEDDEVSSFEPSEEPLFSHEDGGDTDNTHRQDDAPLLAHERSHERDFARSDPGNPEEGSEFSLEHQPTFGYENAGESARTLFGGRGRPGIFRARSNSSTLPHKMPKTDEEDEDLADPSLERFPTRRQQILERVATIGIHLPEEDSVEEHIHSPVSVLSQACSSVDLAPVNSYTSLASVPEAEDSDEEDEVDGDVDSLPSPMVMTFGSASRAFAQDPHTTPMPNNNNQLGHAGNESQTGSADYTTQSSEADSVPKTDGAKEANFIMFQEPTASPSNKNLTLITPPPATENQAKSSDNSETHISAPQIRHRQLPKADETSPTLTPSNQDPGASTPPIQHLAPHPEPFLQTFLRAVFGPITRFLAACISDRKRAGVTVAAIGIVACAAYFVFAGVDMF